MDISGVLRQLRIDKTNTQRKLDQLGQAIAALQKISGGTVSSPRATKRRARRKVTKIARKRMAAAQRARWAKVRQQKVA